MATIAENLERIQSAKTDIKTAIEAKGVTVPSSATIDTYADYVSQISGGGGIQMPSKLDDATLNDYGLLTSASIKSGVTSIGDYAFYNCSCLTSIDIPDSVTSIGQCAFSGCSNLVSINIPSGVTSISTSLFENCSGLSSIDIPNSVTNIGEYAFANCSSLSSVTIPNGVTSIEYGAFEGCYSLSSIDIPNSVTNIGECAFQSCTNLTSCTIGSGVTSIEYGAFEGCYSLTSIAVLADMPPYLGSDVFTNTNDCPIYVPSGSVSDYQEAWSDYASRIQAMPSSSYKWVATYSGGATTSAECDTTFAIASGEINLTNLESVEIGDCVTRINQGAFQNCSSITSCTIGSGVTRMGSDVFNYTNSAMSLTIYATTPPTLDGHIFTGPNAGIFVPSESVNAYKSAPIWSFYAAGIQAIPTPPIPSGSCIDDSGGTWVTVDDNFNTGQTVYKLDFTTGLYDAALYGASNPSTTIDLYDENQNNIGMVDASYDETNELFNVMVWSGSVSTVPIVIYNEDVGEVDICSLFGKPLYLNYGEEPPVYEHCTYSQCIQYCCNEWDEETGECIDYDYNCCEEDECLQYEPIYLSSAFVENNNS